MHGRALARAVRPLVPTTVLAQVWRGANRNLRIVLAGCQVIDLTRGFAEGAGELLATARTNDATDAHVVLCCIAFDATCVTSDPTDIRHLAEAARTSGARRLTRARIPIISV